MFHHGHNGFVSHLLKVMLRDSLKLFIIFRWDPKQIKHQNMRITRAISYHPLSPMNNTNEGRGYLGKPCSCTSQSQTTSWKSVPIAALPHTLWSFTASNGSLNFPFFAILLHPIKTRAATNLHIIITQDSMTTDKAISSLAANPPKRPLQTLDYLLRICGIIQFRLRWELREKLDID